MFFIFNIRFIDIFLLPFQGYLKNLISLHLMRTVLLNIETKYGLYFWLKSIYLEILEILSTKSSSYWHPQVITLNIILYLDIFTNKPFNF